jgi:hypothetical protein
MPDSQPPTPDQGLSVIGWVEFVDLPALDLHRVKAKIDTGARTSALHTAQMEVFTRDGNDWVRFHVQMRETDPERWFEAPVHDLRHIKNTSGIPEERIIIRTLIRLGGQSWPINVSLTDRSNMRLPMIVGRSALRARNIAVHTRRTNLTRPDGQPSRTAEGPSS